MTKLNRGTSIYTGIDVFKLISSFMVVLLHAIETTNYYAVAVREILTWFAVPFFFISSGFFLQKGLTKAENKAEYFKKYVKNLLFLFLVWAVVIYSPIVIHSYVNTNKTESALKIALLLFRRIFIIGPGPYWYLVALLCSAIFIYFCHTKTYEKLLLFVMILGFLLQIGYVSFREILSEISVFKFLFDGIYFVYSWEKNFLMYGIPFMGLGYFFAKKGTKVKPSMAVLMFLASTLLGIFEYNIPKIFPSEFWNGNKIFFAFAFQAISIFLLAKSVSFNISKKTSLFIRQLSSFIYFSHYIFLYYIMNPILRNHTNISTYSPNMILPKTVVTLLVCLLLFVLIKRINNKYLNLLLNG